MNKRVTKEAKTIEKQLFHLQAKRFSLASDATAAVLSLAKTWKIHCLKECKTVEHKEYEDKGRPKKGQKPSQIKYQAIASIQPDEEKISQALASVGHYIIGGFTHPEELSDKEVVEAYKKQHHVVCSFRFLKDPLFFASSLLVKSPKRIMGLLMIMLLSLLVYGIAERRMRASLKEQEQTLPNQIKKEIQNPTLGFRFSIITWYSFG